MRYTKSGVPAVSGVIWIMAAVIVVCVITPLRVHAAFESGSTCSPAFFNSSTCRGAFNPTVNTQVQLPPSGILDYTTFTVPQGVTVSFKKNSANTPVIIRTSGNVLIEGTISLSGSTASSSGTAGDGYLGDDGQPGLGGPGGFDGGYGGYSPLFGGATGKAGGGGKGPGGGQPGNGSSSNYGYGGGGGGFGTGGSNASGGASGGGTYGQSILLPLVGGSGGGGGAAGNSFNGGGGGGGGGGIMIASSDTITIGKNSVGGAGRIYADGGNGGESRGDRSGGSGGGGSGGAIRLVADKVYRLYDAYLYARRGSYGGYDYYNGGYGGYGIIRIEANTTNWSGYTDPGYSFGTPGKVLVPNNPTLNITKVAGVDVPANPTGVADITLPENTTMPVTVNLAATGIPKGTTVTVYLTPTVGGTRSSVLSTALDGASDDYTTATAQVSFIPGNTTLLASATYTVTELVAMSLPKFNGEYVAKIRVESEIGGNSKIVYITASGKEYPADGTRKKAVS